MLDSGAEEAAEAMPDEADDDDVDEAEDADDVDEVDSVVVLKLLVAVVLVAKSNVVESTANSVGEPTKSKLIDDALDAGPEPDELAVDETEVANKCCWFWCCKCCC